jgi:hypothetical protein
MDMTAKWMEKWEKKEPPNEFRRFIGTAKRWSKCRACGGPIEPGTLHLCFRYQDGAWRKKFRLCGFCIWKILEVVKI